MKNELIVQHFVKKKIMLIDYHTAIIFKKTAYFTFYLYFVAFLYTIHKLFKKILIFIKIKNKNNIRDHRDLIKIYSS